MMTVEEQRTMAAIQSINQKLPDLTERDVFALYAMEGLIATYTTSSPAGYEYRIANFAYEMADAMLKAREQK